MAFNPAINKIEKDSRQSGYAGFDQQPQFGQYAQPQQGQAQPQYGQYAQTASAGYAQQSQQQYDQLQQAQYAPQMGGPTGGAGRLTLDDVLVKSAVLLGLVLAVAAGTWVAVGALPGVAMPIWLLGMFGSLALSLAIGFMKTVNVPLILLHAVLQGAFIGAISVTFEASYPGIVIAALTATIGTFVVMLVTWKMGLVKVTSRSMRIFSLMALGYLAFLLINLGLAWFGVFNAYDSPFGWIIGLFGVGMAAYSLAIDFESIKRGVASGLPEKYSWLMGHGLVASLVWLYIEFLRLLSILRSE
ncbi:Uncharacterized membrane protein, YccA/Bax inhibitor family [Kytococcus aerolatus]|uniref:Uncharacterized membrane protein, YccA/Bax inhibitor family n=1 Tax=Kytococcus aerolatus TaxID=592308 RepID=A0A212U7V0_9MICO|nr:Bax inhibitor-1/YccA family protein [Kytococcus aerolatus]SNC74325.1 Uncharacterized membrane protein, YccA/Bax inhibitor family [Kytococcus aerolatus]